MLMVVLYHAGILRGGFVGVDVFLVISGFVIGRVLLSDLVSNDTVQLRQFYLRRIRRLLPALSVMLVTVIILIPVFAPASVTKLGTRTGAASALLMANAYLFRSSGGSYFSVDASLNPLLHTWSLSLEEQFYLVFPLLLLIAWKLSKRGVRSASSLKMLISTTFGVSLALCLWLSYRGPNALAFAFFSPVTRAWQFTAGMGIVLLPSFRTRILQNASTFGGLALIAYAAFAFSDLTVFPGIAAVVPTLGAALVIHGGTVGMSGHTRGELPGPPRPLVHLGNISYSWYLWHWPIIVFAGASRPTSGRWLLPLAAAFSLLPASVSYNWIEQGLKIRKPVPARRTLVLGATCVVAPLLAVGASTLTLHWTQSFPQIAKVEADLKHHIDRLSGCDSPTPLGERPTNSCTWGGRSDSPRVVLIGDSNAGQLSEGLISAAASAGMQLQIATKSACPMADIQIETKIPRVTPQSAALCSNFRDGTIAALLAEPPDVLVVASAVDWYMTPMRDGSKFRLALPGSSQWAEQEDKAALMQGGLSRTLRQLSESARRVILVQTVPKPIGMFDIRRCSRLGFMTNINRCLPKSFRVADLKHLANAHRIERKAAESTAVELLDLTDSVCPHGRCDFLRDGHLTWRDEGHISVFTSQSLSPELTRVLVESTG
ncbi:MAG: acyltransferase [Microthrixaceae bacterium]|nr:acyltransferase [Microthrixaceae bacterium]